MIDTFANRIADWRAFRSPQTKFAFDAPEQALCERRPVGALIHHRDRGSQYESIRYTERLAKAGFEPSVGSCDNAPTETIVGMFKAGVIHRLGSSKTANLAEWETLKWIDRFNNRRLLQPIGNIPSAEAQGKFYERCNESAKVA